MIVYGPHKNTASGALPQVPCALLCCASGDVPCWGRSKASRLRTTPVRWNPLTQVDSDFPELLRRWYTKSCRDNI